MTKTAKTAMISNTAVHARLTPGLTLFYTVLSGFDTVLHGFVINYGLVGSESSSNAALTD